MAKSIAEIQQIELRSHLLKGIGDLNNLKQNLMGIMCSQSCPGDLVLKGFDAAKQIRDQSITVVSGFHSSMEKDIFEILIRGNQPIVHCLAKAIEAYRIPMNLRPRVESGQLTIIAPNFPIAEKRITKATSEMCNALVLEICDQVLIIHAHEGGNLERTCSQYLPYQKKIYALPSEKNEHLFEKGVLHWEIE
ncbi:MAG: hypothetical protein CVU42_00010 [Chloroflexi bacterium HGW-Chloroflexi-4]|jgi:hypothetical protein|nr:MAG: hypothetical protein CVU42_00010 [Chloroflexi bacterium HGW-Chloroflexi-4]